VPQNATALGHNSFVSTVSMMTTVEEAEAVIEVWRANHAAAFAVNMRDTAGYILSGVETSNKHGRSCLF
jgi:hypothetical protein